MYKALKTLLLSALEEIPLGTEISDKDFKDKKLGELFSKWDYVYIEDEKPKKKEVKDEKDIDAK